MRLGPRGECIDRCLTRDQLRIAADEAEHRRRLTIR
jgi:hypothetical protein